LRRFAAFCGVLRRIGDDRECATKNVRNKSHSDVNGDVTATGTATATKTVKVTAGGGGDGDGDSDGNCDNNNNQTTIN
jgi:hypothetical protein